MDQTALPNNQPDFAQKITDFLERKPVIYQFLRFGCIGVMNTALNFLLLNTVSKALGISRVGLWARLMFSVFPWRLSKATYGTEPGPLAASRE